MRSPIEHTLEWLREHGYDANVTEKWNHFAKVRQDLFGFIDVLAVSDDHMIAIQCTDGSHHAEHVEPILQSVVARRLAYHMDIEIWSWRKGLTGERRKDGKLNRRKEWKLRRDALTARLLPKRSLLRRKMEQGTWDVINERN
jgi:hypothetical protein